MEKVVVEEKKRGQQRLRRRLCRVARMPPLPLHTIAITAGDIAATNIIAAANIIAATAASTAANIALPPPLLAPQLTLHCHHYSPTSS